MTTCNGGCLIQCECECYNEVCVCGHREHNGYCPSSCCMPIECRNYKYCNKKLPKWVLFCHNGMCMNCVIQMGKHTYTIVIEDCCVCLETKNMLKLKCNHKICNDCWYTITKKLFVNDDRKQLCPLCRNVNDWSK